VAEVRGNWVVQVPHHLGTSANVQKRKEIKVCIKKVEKFLAEDGQLFDDERGALVHSIATFLECSDEFVDNYIAGNSRFMSLLIQLNEPRNQRPKDIDTRTIADERTQEELQAHAVGFEPPPQDMAHGSVVDVSTLSIPIETIELSDIRPGQIIMVKDVADPFVVDHISTDENAQNLHEIAMRQIVDGVELDHWNALCTIDEVERIVKQPEEVMSLEEAKAALDDIGAQVQENESASPQQHKSIILLNRRIAELTQEQS
jgi:hypothetical protein